MMIVYKPDFEPGYYWAMPVGSSEPILELKFRCQGDPWDPLWMYMITIDSQGRPRQWADMPWYGSSTMVLDNRARQVVEPALGGDAEYLQAYDTDGRDLWLVHPWRVVDALDEELSVVRRFKSADRIMDVRKFVLRAEAIGDARCFRLPQQLHRMFVTEEVVSAVTAAGLHGTRFQPVWQSSLKS